MRNAPHSRNLRRAMMSVQQQHRRLALLPWVIGGIVIVVVLSAFALSGGPSGTPTSTPGQTSAD